MARLARLVVPDIPHHVTQRGNRRQEVFFGQEDYVAYLALMREACARAEVKCLAWCLMPSELLKGIEGAIRAAKDNVRAGAPDSVPVAVSDGLPNALGKVSAAFLTPPSPTTR